MSFEIWFVLLTLVGMLLALIWDKMRPGMVLFTVTALFLCAGIISPKEMLEGFSNKGMITVALLFLVSEGVRQSGALTQIINRILPQGKTTVFKAQSRILPSIAFISAFLNNTPVVVIFAPIIKRWAKSVNLPATKFLIPLSYVTILGGLCTLIGTSTNLVVHGMMIEAGYEGLSMFELSWIGVPVTLAGIIYLFLASKRLLPEERKDADATEEEVEKLEEALPFVENDLSPEAKALIGSQGVCYVDEEGDLVTSIVRGKDCVFTCYDAGGCCTCALERASRSGKLRGFRKPISCFLYPLRVKQYKDFCALNYHRWSVCRAAVQLGEKEDVPVYKFLKEPLTRRFGEAWYAELETAADELKKQGYL